MHCRVCDSTDLQPVLDLGQQPWCNHFLRPEEVGKEPYYPLHLLYCNACHTSQLDYTVKKEVMFGDHTYLSGVTRSLSEHFRNVAQEVDQRFFADRPLKSVLDIGSNDGTQLKHFQALGWDVLGVESSAGTARRANEAGVPTHQAFFNLQTLRDIGRRFDVINASGVFFHLEELHSVTEAVREGLQPNGVFVVQFLYMKSIMENLAFDQIYHEHLLYYTLETISVLLKRHGLELFDAYLAPIHGGSIIASVGHPGERPVSERLQRMLAQEAASGCNTIEAYHDFARRVAQVRERDRAYLHAARASGKRIFGMGAPVKGNTLLNYFGIGTETIECLVEKNELRRDLYSPGMHIPIRIESELPAPPDIYYVLAWNFKKEILANNRALIEQGVEFYFPVDPQ
ncbi:class I SAM-dependent methyltransferase [Ramlibacter sp. G-1-2-2]|uniref:Class I SAM-dependent methyltransferase n=1 Tax=Ramlibacter agri TaxID=2728837 RepID=A0A848GVN3_9BURK|nr:class I SAM-dependent methyltransferase [Ramlibacter agri]NML42706.1 class I SAM-dependent methyltransferase [Ramlibacter agri]